MKIDDDVISLDERETKRTQRSHQILTVVGQPARSTAKALKRFYLAASRCSRSIIVYFACNLKRLLIVQLSCMHRDRRPTYERNHAPFFQARPTLGRNHETARFISER